LARALQRHYNLQLYGYNGVESPHFPPNICGNRWLALYNACAEPGGIGRCGDWDTTVECMGQCASQTDSALPWPNASNDYRGMPWYAHHSRQEVLNDFCACISCSFLPAVQDTDHLHVPSQCAVDTPSLADVVGTLARTLCGNVTASGLFACPGHVWPARDRCDASSGGCFEFAFALGLSDTETFGTLAQATFLGRLATAASVPIDSLFMKDVRAGSVVATAGFITRLNSTVKP
jgi:hypothetical protein